MATRGSDRNEDRSNVRNAKSASGGANAARRESSSTASTNQQSRGAGTQSQSQSQSGTGAPAARGDQERGLQTSREGGDTRQSSSPTRREVGRQSGDVFSPFYSLATSSPFGLMRRMMDDMDQLFSNFSAWPSSEPRGQQLQRGGGASAQRGLQPLSLQSLWAPQVELFERGNNIVVRADLPGLNRDDVDVEVDDDTLVIRGERHNDVEDEREGYYRSERSYGSFYRAIPLPEGIDASACNASFKDGVLEVTIPKPAQQASNAKKINVR